MMDKGNGHKVSWEGLYCTCGPAGTAVINSFGRSRRCDSTFSLCCVQQHLTCTNAPVIEPLAVLYAAVMADKSTVLRELGNIMPSVSDVRHMFTVLLAARLQIRCPLHHHTQYVQVCTLMTTGQLTAPVWSHIKYDWKKQIKMWQYKKDLIILFLWT